MQAIREVKERQIKETRRRISYTGSFLKEEEAGIFFANNGRGAARYRARLPEVTDFLKERERKAWEKLTAVKRERFEKPIQKAEGHVPYTGIQTEGGFQYEDDIPEFRFPEVETEKEIPYMGPVRQGKRPGTVPQVGGRKRADAAGQIQTSETYTGLEKDQIEVPPTKESGTSVSVQGRYRENVFRAKSAEGGLITASGVPAGAATGGTSAVVRIGAGAVKKAAKAFADSVRQKDETKRQTAKGLFAAKSADPGSGFVSSSYAAGASGVFVRVAAVAAATGIMLMQAMLLPVIMIVFAAVILLTTLFSTITAAFTIFGAPGDISYLNWAVEIAADDSHGYSQAARTGPDYDCSSFVWYALTGAGYELGEYPFATGSMPSILAAAGFEQLPYTGMDDLMPGDILWVHGDEAQHTEIYMGDGQLVGAACDLDGGQPGDQSGTGGEIRVGEFYNDGWMGVFRSTSVGIGDIEIPAVYEGYEVGTIYTCTPHYGTWNWVYNQGRVHEAWIQAGSVYSENVAMIDDKYLIACTETFGTVGDWVTFYFENGEAIECIIADAKSPGDANWTPWGHIHGMQIDVIEAETNLTINPGTPGCMESWGGRRVVSATNHGAFI